MRRSIVALGVIAIAALSSTASSQGELATHLPAGGITNLGWRIAYLGDVNGDGLGDYAYADVFQDGGPNASGTVTVRSGAGFGVLYEVSGTHFDADLGRGLAATGDLDGDGVPDFAVISDDLAELALVTAHSGVDGALLGTLGGATEGEAFSSSLAAAGDVDLDGVPDVVLGLPHADDPVFNAGAVRVLGGDGSGVIRNHTGDASADLWGLEVFGVGDVDDDGFMDYGSGSAQVDGGGINRGMLRVYAGQTGAVLHELVGENDGDFLSKAAALGDVDGDGFDDFLVSAPGWGPFGGQGKYGRVQALSGQTGAELWSASGSTSSSDMGRAISSIGDLDDDGVPDALLGVPDLDDFEHGLVEVRSGVDGALLFSVESFFGGDEFGAALAAGDVNGDGVDDLIVGSPGKSRVQLFTPTCGAFIEYGDGCAGSGGITPTLDLAGCASPGAEFSMDIGRSLGGAPAMLVLGVGPLDAPIFGCTLLAEPSVLVPLQLTGSGAGMGTLLIPTELPVPTPLVSIYLQVFVMDAGGPNGWAASAGVELIID